MVCGFLSRREYLYKWLLFYLCASLLYFEEAARLETTPGDADKVCGHHDASAAEISLILCRSYLGYHLLGTVRIK